LSQRKKPYPEAKEPAYQPTDREIAALERHVARLVAAPSAPRIRVTKVEKVPAIELDHPDNFLARGLLMEALGTVGSDFANGLLRQLINAGSHGREIDEDGLNFMLSVVTGIKPKDQLEAMLAAQMAAVHFATMTFSRRLARVETIQQQDSAERALNKLARTYTTQMEALKRYRTGGEQKVTVQHVSVSEGGQAIVGNVTQAGRETTPEKPANSTPALTDVQKPPMTILGEPARAAVPSRRKQKDDGSSSA
jgi:hypothetical protein